MKPEDLKPPYSRDERRTVIHDSVWYVVQRAATPEIFTFPGWEHPDLFGNANPVHVEYCSGNGAWIAAKAIAHPEINWVAVERKFERVKKIWSKIKNHQLKNLIVVAGEAYETTRRFIPEGSVSAIYINFPDPWPKKRHAKHRLIQVPFVEEMWRILTPDTHLMFVTDDVPYSDWFIEVVGQHGKFSSSFPLPYYVTDESDYGTSYFDQLWRSKGRSIRYHRFSKPR